MGAALHVLLVEDSADDAELILRQLRRGGYEPTARRVETAAELDRALDEEHWDLLIADHALPQFSGLEALKQINRRGVDFPFIIVSGRIGEDVAVAAMKAGAQDYLLKQNLTRLPAAVERELREADGRRARRAAEAALAVERVKVELANAELQRKNKKLLDLCDTAQKFVDNVSHEFRTPLTVIKGYAEVIATGLADGSVLANQQAEYLDIIIDRTRDLARMVDDMLDGSKLRAGSLRVDRRRHTIEEIIAPLRPILRGSAVANGIQFVEELAADLPPVFADAQKAGRVMLNLTANAIKFSDEGGEVKLWARPTTGGGVTLGVTDHGPGIAPENLSIIFQRFKQIGDPQRSATRGFGLGLNIAKELVALNFGQMDIKSHLHVGSTFSFTLPPDDAEAVMQGYLDYLKALGAEERNLVVLKVKTSTRAEQIHAALASLARPTDLIRQSEDQQSLLIIGCVENAGVWAQHLSNRADVVVETLCVFPYPAGQRQAADCLLAALEGNTANGTPWREVAL